MGHLPQMPPPFQHVEAGPPTGGGGATGEFCPGPQPERGPRRPHEGPLEY